MPDPPFWLPEPDHRAVIGYEIGTIGIHGKGQRRLTENNFFDGYPTWSPNGTSLAFVSTRGHERGLYREEFARIYTVPDQAFAEAHLVTIHLGAAALAPRRGRRMANCWRSQAISPATGTG